MHSQGPLPNLPFLSLLGSSSRKDFLLCSSPCPCNPARGFLCRFYHPRWPKRLLPVLISGLQSTPETPTRHAPLRVANTNSNSSLSCQISSSAKYTIMAAASAGRWRGGVSFPAAKRRIANSLWLLFVSPLSSARPSNMIQQLSNGTLPKGK